MENIFPVEWQSDIFWFETTTATSDLVAVRQMSAFVPYYHSNSNRPTNGFRDQNNTAGIGIGNLQKRVMEFSRKRWREKRELESGGDVEKEKCHRHMINERLRREKQKQSYLALHSMLPKGTKNDKNSIVQMATGTIQELKAYEVMLERRNSELQIMNLPEKKQKERENGTVIRLKVANPSSGINSMLAVLNFLKTFGVNARAMHTTFSDTEFSAQLIIDTQMEAAEVERALQITLSEVERKLHGYC